MYNEQKLIELLSNRPKEHNNVIVNLQTEGNKLLKKKDFVRYMLLQSFSTWGNSRGYEKLMGDKKTYEKVSYEHLKQYQTLAPDLLNDHLTGVLQDAGIRYAQNKGKYLTDNFFLIQQLGGIEEVNKQAFTCEGAIAKIKFFRQFKGIGPQYSKNIRMDTHHNDFRNTIAFHSRINKIAELIGIQNDAIDIKEKIFLDIAHAAKIDGWTLDRLLYNFYEYYLNGLL